MTFPQGMMWVSFHVLTDLGSVIRIRCTYMGIVTWRQDRPDGSNVSLLRQDRQTDVSNVSPETIRDKQMYIIHRKRYEDANHNRYWFDCDWSMYVCMYTYVCMHVCMYMYACMYVYVCMCMHVYMCSSSTKYSFMSHVYMFAKKATLLILTNQCIHGQTLFGR